jgi:UDP-N-acetylmuramoylalanine--D-glutamate ligase
VIPIKEFAGRDVAVFGLTRGGTAAARALTAGGAKVHAWDDNDTVRARAESEGIALDDINARDWRGLAALVVSPAIAVDGIKPHRIVELARAIGAPVYNDVELFARAVHALAPHARPRVVGLSGALGDQACAALLGHILVSAGKDARVGGEGGASVLDLQALHAGAIYVLALSEAQLALTETLRCDVAVMLAPEGAGQAEALFANQGVGDWAILGVDTPDAAALCTRLTAAGGASVLPISARAALGRGVSALGPFLFDAFEGPVRRIARVDPGVEDSLRAAGAYAAARALGLEPRAIEAALASFPGEWVAPQSAAPPRRRSRERSA